MEITQLTFSNPPANTQHNKRRVAAYVRVSTLLDTQEESLTTQYDYFTRYILSHEDWTLVEIFADHGISGTSTKQRAGFLKMLDAAKEHRFDLLLCKSISRFSRNLKDTITYVQQLKLLGIEIIFENEHLSTFNPSGELLLNILASIAQEESRSISNNVRWTRLKNAQKGIRHLGSGRILAYDEINGELTPNQDAWIVKRIFAEYAEGAGMSEIAHGLQGAVFHFRSKLIPIKPYHVSIILRHEIYVGDRHIQKKPPKGMSQLPGQSCSYDSFYVQNAHTAIIDRETWNTVCMRIKNLQPHRPFTQACTRFRFIHGYIICGICGETFRRLTRTIKTTHGKQHYSVWRCRNIIKHGKTGCTNRTIREDFLVSEIANIIGSKPTESAVLNMPLFYRLVKRVIVYPDRIEIIRNDMQQL